MQYSKSFISNLFCLFIISTTTAQIAITTDESLPDSSAMLDVKSPDKGLLPPRIEGTDQINNPAEGLIIYDLNQHCLKYFNGAWWSDCLGTFSTAACTDSITDVRDGQKYAVAQIGNQCWMADNLNVGIPIDISIDPSDNGIIEKYCYDNISGNCDSLGGLYTWNELMAYTTIEKATGICPEGWHIPSDLEVQAVEIYLGMSVAEANMFFFRGTNQGSQMAGNEALWEDGPLDTDAGFGASQLNLIPAGAKNVDDSFINLYEVSYLWTSTEELPATALRRYIFAFSPKSVRAGEPKEVAFSVRCVRD